MQQDGPVGSPARRATPAVTYTVNGTLTFAGSSINLYDPNANPSSDSVVIVFSCGSAGSANCVKGSPNDVPITDTAVALPGPSEFGAFFGGAAIGTGYAFVDVSTNGVIQLLRLASYSSAPAATITLSSELFKQFATVDGPTGSIPAAARNWENLVGRVTGPKDNPRIAEWTASIDQITPTLDSERGILTLSMSGWPGSTSSELSFFVLQVRPGLMGGCCTSTNPTRHSSHLSLTLAVVHSLCVPACASCRLIPTVLAANRLLGVKTGTAVIQTHHLKTAQYAGAWNGRVGKPKLAQLIHQAHMHDSQPTNVHY